MNTIIASKSRRTSLKIISDLLESYKSGLASRKERSRRSHVAAVKKPENTTRRVRRKPRGRKRNRDIVVYR